MAERNRKTWLDEILLALVSRLMDELPLPPELIHVNFPDEPDAPPPGDRYITVTPEDQVPIVGFTAGAGLLAPGFEGAVTVALFTRLSTDKQGDAEYHLTDLNHGALPYWKRVVKALHLFDPVDDQGEDGGDDPPLLMEPMRLLRIGFKPRKVPLSWGGIAGTWEVKYLADIT